MSGRFAPSPTGPLHLGNLRTAAISWLSARRAGLDYIVRVEDLDRVTSSVEHERRQLDDLAAVGLDWEAPVVRQSERFERYHEAIGRLAGGGLVYECFCSRREVRLEIDAAPQAPHLPPGAYPGTCRQLTAARRRALVAEGRRPALRLLAADDDGVAPTVAFDDRVAGRFDGGVDDVVLRRNDGVPSYNVAVVVDDAAQGISEVVRGDDLLDSTPRQIHLQRLLDLPTPAYAHVPLVVGDDGERLAKRHGAVTLADLAERGVGAERVAAWIVSTLGQHGAGDASRLSDVADTFDVRRVASPPVVAPPFP